MAIPTRDLVDAALNRLLCDLALGADGELAETAHRSAELVALVVGLGSPVLDQLIANVAVAGNPHELEQALAAFSEVWNGWTVHGDAMAEPGNLPNTDAPTVPLSSVMTTSVE